MKICDQGIVLQNRKCNGNSCIIKILGSKNGKWSGFYSLKKPSILIGSTCDFEWSATSIADLGKLKVETIKPSRMSSMWNNPLLMSAFGVICESAASFIPDGIKNNETFLILSSILEKLAEDCIYLCVKEWESYLLREYFDIQSRTTTDDFKGFIGHCDYTPLIKTKLRQDFCSLARLIERNHTKTG